MGFLDLEKNKDVYVNFGIIANGRLADIEKLQIFLKEQLRSLKVVYCIVTSSHLYLLKNQLRRPLKHVENRGI